MTQDQSRLLEDLYEHIKCFERGIHPDEDEDSTLEHFIMGLKMEVLLMQMDAYKNHTQQTPA